RPRRCTGRPSTAGWRPCWRIPGRASAARCAGARAGDRTKARGTAAAAPAGRGPAGVTCRPRGAAPRWTARRGSKISSAASTRWPRAWRRARTAATGSTASSGGCAASATPRLRDDLQISERVRGRDHDGVEAALVELARDRDFRDPGRGNPRAFGGQDALNEILATHAGLVAAADEFATLVDADLAALLHGELRGTVERYEALKQAAGRVDFFDLLLRARDLVRDDAGVRAVLQDRFSHIFVDEFQDTDPLQAEILLLLASDDPAVTDWREVTPG